MNLALLPHRNVDELRKRLTDVNRRQVALGKEARYLARCINHAIKNGPKR